MYKEIKEYKDPRRMYLAVERRLGKEKAYKYFCRCGRYTGKPLRPYSIALPVKTR